MRLWFCTLVLSVIFAAEIAAQGTTTLPPTQLSVYRPVGERRLWTLVVNDSSIGQLISTTTGPTSLDGLNGSGINEILSVDYTKVGASLVMQIASNHLVTEAGGYLGDDMVIKTGEKIDSLRLVHAGDSIIGSVSQSGVRQPRAVAIPGIHAAWDVQFVDQLELYLATHGLTVGQVLRDSLFAPRPMIPILLEGTVDGFGRANVYNQVYDSGFIINLTQPQQMKLLFTKDRRLVKVDIPDQNTRIFLDAVTPPRPALPKPPGVTVATVVSRMPAFLVFLIVTGAVLWFFLGRQITLVHGYIAAGISAAVFGLVPFTQIPLQQAAITKGLIPALRAGGSIYLWGMVPALIAGLVQTLLLVAVIQMIREVRRLKPEKMWILGAFCGAGFGFMEACYLAVTIPAFTLWSFGILERGFLLIFQVSAGLLIGLAMKRGLELLIQTAILLAIVNAVMRYIPVFAQQQIVGPELLSVLLAFVSLSTAFGALLWMRRPHSAAPSESAARHR